MTMHTRPRVGMVLLTTAALIMAATPTWASGKPVWQDGKLVEPPAWVTTLAPTDINGGLVVHIGGDDDGTIADGLLKHGAGLVVGLGGNVSAARKAMLAKGIYGQAIADEFDGKSLPFADNVVNLVVTNRLKALPLQEVLRVLRPGGKLICKHGETPTTTTKPYPSNIDEWTHYLHNAGNNAVAEDTVIGPPRRMQWLAGPKWTRTHHGLNSVSSVVTAGGRLFTIVDRGPAADLTIAPKWTIVARDAFNGIELWNKSIDSWADHNGRFRSGPAQVTRLLATNGKRLYAPLGLSEPVSAIDAATGGTLATYKATTGAEEIILTDKVLLVLTGDPVAEHAAKVAKTRGARLPNKKAIVAIDTATGKKLWRWADDEATPMPETLAADETRAYIQSGGSTVCFDLQTGDVKWRYGDVGAEKRGRRIGFGKHVLVVSDGVVLCNLARTLVAIDAATGKKLWSITGGTGFHAPMDIFVINGVVWTGIHPQDSISPSPVNDFSAGRDLRTGKVISKNTVMVDLQTAGHHHRCYREKATSRFILTGKRGVEMMDLTGKEHSRNNWVRGTCQYGILPANGLLYAPSHSCGCYMESKLWGFWALAPDGRKRTAAPDATRLTKGPAYGHKISDSAKTDTWPQLRNDALRSGVAGTAVPAKLTTAWAAPIGGKLTQPVIALGKVLVASVDVGVVYAIDEKTGKTAWSFAAGGRVDSPPTIHGDVALFGSADGRVYCVRLSDGELVWKFLAARSDIRTVAYERVESLWPVHGSVLVLDGLAYIAAGRSTWIDGGIDMYALDPSEGTIRHKYAFTSPHPVIGEGKDKAKPEHDAKAGQTLSDYKTHLQPDKSDSFSMAGGAIADVLTSDGTNVFMHHAKFDAELTPQSGLTRHLFSTSNLLDGEENHRSHWVLGSGDFSMVPVAYSWIVNSAKPRWGGIASPVGLMMAFTDKALWTVRRSGNKGAVYTLQAKLNTPFSAKDKPLPDFGRTAPKSVTTSLWTASLPFRPRAMVKAGENLLLAGHPTSADGVSRHDLYAGKGAGVLHVISATDGATAGKYKLDSPAVWDGMAAANGRLYISTTDGKVVCMGDK